MNQGALQVGEPTCLPPDEMDRVLEKFRTYGQPGNRFVADPQSR